MERGYSRLPGDAGKVRFYDRFLRLAGMAGSRAHGAAVLLPRFPLIASQLGDHAQVVQNLGTQSICMGTCGKGPL